MSKFDDPPAQFGQVHAGIFYKTHEQAMFLQNIIEDGMRKHAGKPQERLLAKWYNEIESQRSRAKKEKWLGWESSDDGRSHGNNTPDLKEISNE